LLVQNPSDAPSGKVKKALDYGITIRTRAAFEEEFYISK